MQTPKSVKDFLAQRRIAVAGVSRNSNKWGNVLFRELRKRGYEAYPLNPTATELEGSHCYSSLQQIPRKVDALLIATPARTAKALVQDAVAAGVSRVWFQQGAGRGSDSPEALEYCREHGLQAITGACPMMFLAPVGLPHRIHAWWRLLLGKIPRC
jgi:predicted CoA-binding protein